MPHGKRTSTNLWKKRPKSKLIGAAAHNEVALSPAQQLGSLSGAARARGAAAWVAVGAQPHLRAPSAGADSRM